MVNPHRDAPPRLMLNAAPGLKARVKRTTGPMISCGEYAATGARPELLCRAVGHEHRGRDRPEGSGLGTRWEINYMIEAAATTIVDPSGCQRRLGADIVLPARRFNGRAVLSFARRRTSRGRFHTPPSLPPAPVTLGRQWPTPVIGGKRCTVVMPLNSAKVKIAAVGEYGARVDLVDTATVRREERVAELAAADPSAYVASAYDDPSSSAAMRVWGASSRRSTRRRRQRLVARRTARRAAGRSMPSWRRSAAGASRRDTDRAPRRRDSTPVWGSSPRSRTTWYGHWPRGDSSRTIVSRRPSRTECAPQRRVHNWSVLQSGWRVRSKCRRIRFARHSGSAFISPTSSRAGRVPLPWLPYWPRPSGSAAADLLRRERWPTWTPGILGIVEDRSARGGRPVATTRQLAILRVWRAARFGLALSHTLWVDMNGTATQSDERPRLHRHTRTRC